MRCEKKKLNAIFNPFTIRGSIQDDPRLFREERKKISKDDTVKTSKYREPSETACSCTLALIKQKKLDCGLRVLESPREREKERAAI